MTLTSREILAQTITEADFQANVITYAQLRGWKVMHTRPAQTNNGYRTAVSGDGQGFFDLVLMRDRVIFAELKVKNRKQTRHQLAWYEQAKTANAEVYVWHPKHWPEIERILK